jgi:hypothetical protein
MDEKKRKFEADAAPSAKRTKSEAPEDEQQGFLKRSQKLSDADVKKMRQMSRVNKIFVNRANELKDLFSTNALCNDSSRDGVIETQEYTIPVVAMTFGAGKSELARNYLPQLRKWISKESPLDSYQQAALDSLAPHHDQLQELCAEDTADVSVNCTSDLNEVYGAIYLQLQENHAPTWPHFPLSPPLASLSGIVQFILRTKAVFIHLDEIGRLEQADALGKLKIALGEIHIAIAKKPEIQRSSLKPLHLFLSGKVDRATARKMNDHSRIACFLWNSIGLEPLKPEHVALIRKKLDLSFSADEQVNDHADAHVALMTAGVPRQIWRMLTAASVLKLQFESAENAKKSIEELCYVVANQPQFANDLVNISADPLMLSEYIEMHMRAISRTPITDATCSRYLPLTLTQGERSDEWLVQTAPIFTDGLELKMKEYLSVMKKLPETEGAWQKQERNVSETLYSYFAYHSYISQLSATPPPMTLHQLFPFLEDTGVLDQELPHTNIEVSNRLELPRFGKTDTASYKFRVASAQGIVVIFLLARVPHSNVQ